MQITTVVDCPATVVGRVIGKGGESIKMLQMQSGCRIQIDQNFPEGAPRKISISGPAHMLETARAIVNEVITGAPAAMNAASMMGMMAGGMGGAAAGMMGGYPGAAVAGPPVEQVAHLRLGQVGVRLNVLLESGVLLDHLGERGVL